MRYTYRAMLNCQHDDRGNKIKVYVWPNVYLRRFNLTVTHGPCVNDIKRETKILSQTQFFKAQKNVLYMPATPLKHYDLRSRIEKYRIYRLSMLQTSHSYESNKLYDLPPPSSLHVYRIFIYSVHSLQTTLTAFRFIH